MNTNAIENLSAEECVTVAGGRMKLPGVQHTGGLLVSGDGEPVTVIVDGVVVNSVADGFVHV